jgi:hypothetical protein
MKLIIGKIKEVQNRFLVVSLPDGETIKTIRANPLNLDEREQKPNIKIGTECLTLFDERTHTGITCFSISQALTLANKIYRIEQEEIQLYAKRIRIMSCSGDNTSTVEEIGDEITIHFKKFAIKSESEELITCLLDLIDAIVGQKTICMAIHKAAPLEPLDGGTIAKLLAIKQRVDSFKS